MTVLAHFPVGSLAATTGLFGSGLFGLPVPDVFLGFLVTVYVERFVRLMGFPLFINKLLGGHQFHGFLELLRTGSKQLKVLSKRKCLLGGLIVETFLATSYACSAA